ncbi:hypothetical protein Tco_1072796 [Tanacetum coccineum]
MVEEEPVKKMSMKELLKLNEELAFNLQAKEDEEERLARGKAQKVEEANIAWDDIQAKVEADYQLAQRLQAQEQEKLSGVEKATLFVQLLEKRRKHFAAKRVEEKRNRPPTKAQQRSFMCTYLKNMEGWKPKDLKNNSKKAEADIAQESNSKRAGEDLEQESSKKQKVDDDKETEELKQCMEIISDDGDDVTIKATPLSTKSPTIIDYKIYKEGKRSYFQIIKADVKARFKKTDPVNYMDTFLHLNLKTMFEHHLEDNVWKNQQGLVKVLNWKLYDSCGMFNDVKLQVDYECEMEFELLRLVKKQLKEGYGRIVGIAFHKVTAVKEVEINKKNKNQAKMTKLSMRKGKTVQKSRPKSKMPKSESILTESAVKPEPELKNTLTVGAILTHLMVGKAQ